MLSYRSKGVGGWFKVLDRPRKSRSESGICIFRLFALIARRSKYDFWIPDKILDQSRKKILQKIYFQPKNFSIEKKIKCFFFKIEKKSDPKKKSEQKNFDQKKIDQKNFNSKIENFNFFIKTFFLVFDKKIVFVWSKFMSRPKIVSGIQKSYLERRMMSTNMWKL